MRPRRGGILLELLLAIALFAAAASFTMSALRSATDGVRRADLRARAADLAESRLAEVDAGLLSAGELGDEQPSESDSELAVSIEVIDGGASTLARVRATVRDATATDRTVLAVAERLVDLARRAESGARP
ncbi:MAG: hypothetical protein ACKOYN_08770 [Planctomycetota bacterium]